VVPVESKLLKIKQYTTLTIALTYRAVVVYTRVRKGFMIT